MSIKSKILSLINIGNETTGQEDDNLTDMIQNLIDGYGTGSQAVLGQKTITANGTYSATDDEYDGYSQVTVNVSQGGSTLITKNISANGTYNASSDSADGYSQVTVAVPASAVDSGTKSITANGNGQDVVGYAAVNVNVPNSYSAGDEGKVVSNGALVAQTSDTVTENDTYDTTLIDSLIVNVSGGGSSVTAATGTVTLVSDVAMPTANQQPIAFPGLQLPFEPDFIYIIMDRNSFNLKSSMVSGLYGLLALKKSLAAPFANSASNYFEDAEGDHIILIHTNTMSGMPTDLYPNGYALRELGWLGKQYYGRYSINSDGTISVARYSSAGTVIVSGVYRYFAIKV